MKPLSLSRRQSIAAAKSHPATATHEGVGTVTEDMKETARRKFEDLWNKRQETLIEELFAPDFVGHDPSTAEPIRGVEGYREWMHAMIRGVPDLQFEVHEYVAEGAAVVVRWTLRGTQRGEWSGIPPTNRPVEITGMTLYRAVGGKLAEMYNEFDSLGLMRQLGLLPPPIAAKLVVGVERLVGAFR